MSLTLTLTHRCCSLEMFVEFHADFAGAVDGPALRLYDHRLLLLTRERGLRGQVLGIMGYGSDMSLMRYGVRTADILRYAVVYTVRGGRWGLQHPPLLTVCPPLRMMKRLVSAPPSINSIGGGEPVRGGVV